MRVIVCIKQILAVKRVHLDQHNNLMREGIPGVMNPADKRALEFALNLREQQSEPVEIIALSMGPNDSEQSLRQALSLGADRGILLSSRAFGGADTLATANTLVAGINKIGNADLILLGAKSQDADTGQVGPLIASKLDIPQVTYISELSLQPSPSYVTARREVADGIEEIQAGLPAVCTVAANRDTERESQKYPTLMQLRKSMEADLTIWNEKDLGVDVNTVGINGSPTVVTRVFSPQSPERKHIALPEDPKTAVDELLKQLPANSKIRDAR